MPPFQKPITGGGALATAPPSPPPPVSSVIQYSHQGSSSSSNSKNTEVLAAAETGETMESSESSSSSSSSSSSHQDGSLSEHRDEEAPRQQYAGPRGRGGATTMTNNNSVILLEDTSTTTGEDHHEDDHHDPKRNKNKRTNRRKNSGDNNDSDDHSSTNHQSSASSSRNNKNQEQEEELVRKETQQVFVLRIVVVLILLCAGAAVSVVVYFITTNAEDDEFVSNFESAARIISETFLAIPTTNMGAIGGLVVANVAHGVDHFRKWPFVTLSSFQQRSYATRKLSLALQICVVPIVQHDDRLEWESFSNNSTLSEYWFEQGIAYQQARGIMSLDERTRIPVDPTDPELNLSSGIGNRIFHFGMEPGDRARVSPEQDMYLPIYQVSPISLAGEENMNLASNDVAAVTSVQEAAVVFGKLHQDPPGPPTSEYPRTAEMATLITLLKETAAEYDGDAYSKVYLPIFDNFSDQRKPVGTMRAIIQWARYFREILPSDTKGVIVVLHNQGCDLPYTYRIDGTKVVPLGAGDLHDHNYNYLVHTASFLDVQKIEDGTAFGMKLIHGECPYSISIYPSSSMENNHKSSSPLIMTFSVTAVFLFTILMFFVYDRLVERRQRLILRKAERTNAIVSSLFPKTVRERLMDDKDKDHNKKRGGFLSNPLDHSEQAGLVDPHVDAAPIADLFPHATVLFADIAGFTAWSSSREPAQVFALLQAVYKAFDFIANKRRVFKVETIGDSYVAVTGLPDPQPLHAVIMARFAQDCMDQMDVVVKRLEQTLGPDTGDLKMRFGMHSGPVTAGVLAGERSRFQLFGDTVNTAARMESTGVHSKIHCSQTTAELLTKSGKGHWVVPRNSLVQAKGKGVLKTFWVNPRANSQVATSDETNKSDNFAISSGDSKEKLPSSVDPQVEKSQKEKRLIDWMTEMLVDHVKPIVAKHSATGSKHQSSQSYTMSSKLLHANTNVPPIDELVEVIKLAPYDEKMVDAVIERPNVTIPDAIKELIRQFVGMIAQTYRDNPFHNFEHASHVTMTVVKFLKRVVRPNLSSTQLKEWKQGLKDAKEVHSQLHDYTHGISGDPLALFAIVFSAMIHDADHRGVSNIQLAKEEQRMAEIFKFQSVAEQNSVAIAWKLLLSDQFSTLRQFLFPKLEELTRFRQIVVNVVLATDIFDKELNELRKGRWSKAFSGLNRNQILTVEQNNLRATIVIEHIIQASDVAHTMQHWHIYQKWNKRLFKEMLMAYREGRMGADPATFWYKGEIGFFDNYIIPLARKLEECNVFGVASDECLNYAIRNRDEWVSRGEEQVRAMLEEFKDLYDGVVTTNHEDDGKSQQPSNNGDQIVEL